MEYEFATKVMSIIKEFESDGKYPTYYELETKAGGKKVRIDLIYLLRDFYASQKFPKEFFDTLLTNQQYPIEAGLIIKEKQKENFPFYKVKKDTHISFYNDHGYITSTGLNKRQETDKSGSVFLNALSNEPQTLEQLTNKLLQVFKGVDYQTILPDAKEFYDNLVNEGFLTKAETIEEIEKADNSCKNIQDKYSESAVNFYLPGLDTDFLNFFVEFAKYSKRHSERFMDNLRIASFYGTFKNAIWAGGRLSHGMMPEPIDVEDSIHKINDAGVAARFTFTNSVIEERHLNDTYCNFLMEVANNGKNEVLVNSPVLENYLRKQYPNFKYIQSITACEHNIDKINQATEKYDLVVLDFHDNKKEAFLNEIKHKDKIEILIDGFCPTECCFSKKHYENISKINCFQGNENEGGCLQKNRTPQKSFYDGLKLRKDTNLTFDEVYRKYYNMGFRHFKLVGRNEPSFYVFESLIYYLVKPEFRDEVRAELADYYIDYLIKFYGGFKTPKLDFPIKIKK